MIATRPVVPFSFDTEQHDLLKPTKQVALAFNQGSIFALFDGDIQTGHLLDVFKFEKLFQSEDWVRWTLRSNSGMHFDGALRELAVYKDRLLLRPTNPLIVSDSPFGKRVQFKLNLPYRYQVHHFGFVLKRASSGVPSKFVWDR